MSLDITDFLIILDLCSILIKLNIKKKIYYLIKHIFKFKKIRYLYPFYCIKLILYEIGNNNIQQINMSILRINYLINLYIYISHIIYVHICIHKSLTITRVIF